MVQWSKIHINIIVAYFVIVRGFEGPASRDFQNLPFQEREDFRARDFYTGHFKCLYLKILKINFLL